MASRSRTHSTCLRADEVEYFLFINGVVLGNLLTEYEADLSSSPLNAAGKSSKTLFERFRQMDILGRPIQTTTMAPVGVTLRF